MGCEVLDPHHIEGKIGRLPGLGLLPVSTTITEEKITRQSCFALLPLMHEAVSGGMQKGYSADCGYCSKEDLSGRKFNLRGYEIHMGESVPLEGLEPRPLNVLEDGRMDGCLVSQKCMGTYMHGILDNGEFVEWLIAPYVEKSEAREFDYAAFKEEQYDKLAGVIREHVDIEKLYKILGRDD